jgi:Asp-tRNA(Asn)/Glu-tRNA(Gln) amidotransferase A subunit family amidase
MATSPFDPNGPMADLARLSLADLSTRIQRREISCREAVEGYLTRISAYDGPEGLNAFITGSADQAQAEAARLDQLLDRGTYLGPLHGVPVAVKDNLDTAGLRTTGGSKVLAHHVPATDATVVARLKAAGAIVLGKTNMHEFAFGITTNNPHYGPAHNPHDRSRITGGSSGGSAAAVAAGLCAGAIGTDTGGSIRIPSALCGCIGLKPTLGRVGRGGLMYLSSTCDCIGPITRSAEDAALILSAIAGADERDPGASTEAVPAYAPLDTAGWEGVRLGVPRHFFYEGNDPAVAQAMGNALERMAGAGAEPVDVEVGGLEDVIPAGFAIVLAETVHLLGAYLRQVEPPVNLADVLDQLGPDVREILGGQVGPEAAPIPGYVYLDAVRTFREAFQANMAAALRDVDALVIPTTPLPAAPIGDDAETMLNGQMVETFGTFIRYTFLVNIAGNPAITVPVGSSDTGLPIGMQFIGHPWQEAKLLHLAHAWESQP